MAAPSHIESDTAVKHSQIVGRDGRGGAGMGGERGEGEAPGGDGNDEERRQRGAGKGSE